MSCQRLLRALACLRATCPTFKDPAEEASFTLSLQIRLIESTMACVLVGMVLGLMMFPATYVSETRRPVFAFKWEIEDPRTPFFAGVLFDYILGSFLLVVGTFHIFTERLQAWKWEWISTASACSFLLSLPLTSGWHISSLYGMPNEDVWVYPDSNSENVVVCTLLAVVTVVHIYVPIRVVLVWLVPTAAVTAFILMVSVAGSRFPETTLRIAVLLLAVSCCSFQGARRHEEYAREKWLANKRIQEQDAEITEAGYMGKALFQVANSVCDIVCMLDSQGGFVNTEDKHTLFFEQVVSNGTFFADLLPPGARAAFENLLTAAGTTKQLQTGVVLVHSELPVKLIVVHTSANYPTYIVGVSAVRRGQTTPGRMLENDAEHRASPFSVMRDDSRSLPSTTQTGRIFGCANERPDRSCPGEPSQEGDMKRDTKGRLWRMAQVGYIEHWLVDPSEVQVLPSRVLGRGGFGVVVLARLRGTVVAMKLPRRNLCDNQSGSVFAAVANEIRVHRHLRHPNIVAFYGACIDPNSGDLALLYELVQGVPLDNFLPSWLDGTASELIRLKLLLDVVSALRYMHSLQPAIVHGDIETSNVIVERGLPLRAKLLDFGLSRLLTRKAKATGGTKQWMAPELLHAGPDVRAQIQTSADVFSFGLLSHYMMTGIRPSKVKSGGSSADQDRVLEWPEGTPYLTECRDLCEQCMRRDATQRPSIVEVGKTLLTWLPNDADALKKMGWEVLALLLPARNLAAGFEDFSGSALSPSICDASQAAEELALPQGYFESHASQKKDGVVLPVEASNCSLAASSPDGAGTSISSVGESMLPEELWNMMGKRTLKGSGAAKVGRRCLSELPRKACTDNVHVTPRGTLCI